MSEQVPMSIVIFGASGDLTKRKLVPALFQLAREKLLSKNTKIVGFARREKTHEQFRSEMKEALIKFSRSMPKPGSAELNEFMGHLYYYAGNYDEARGFQALST